jgi:hypothetical protein
MTERKQYVFTVILITKALRCILTYAQFTAMLVPLQLVLTVW